MKNDQKSQKLASLLHHSIDLEPVLNSLIFFSDFPELAGGELEAVSKNGKDEEFCVMFFYPKNDISYNRYKLEVELGSINQVTTDGDGFKAIAEIVGSCDALVLFFVFFSTQFYANLDFRTVIHMYVSYNRKLINDLTYR